MTVADNSIALPVWEKCAFCEYLAGRRPYAIIKRTDAIAVMVTREQRGVPHLLVVPLRHKETILDLEDRESADLIIGVRQVARAIDKAYRRTGIAVWQNNGVSARQTIRHVHFHVAGALDAGGTEWGLVSEISLDDAMAIGNRLLPYLEI